MSIPSAPATLTFTGSDARVTRFDLVDVAGGMLTYRGALIQDSPIPVNHAPILTISRRSLSKNQTTRKYQLKFTFPMFDGVSNVVTGNVLIVKDISIPNSWPGTTVGSPLSHINAFDMSDVLRSVDTAFADPAFVAMVADATFPR